ncbi:MAG: ABC transporter substrate-binding protein [Propionibacteriaceae bacterium]|nr:ABC transporter substrate-binding protein [Propionibacteriaceae bacterium]
MKPRRLLATSVAVAAALCLTLTGCTPTETKEEGEFTIGVAVIASHPALEAAQQGFTDVLDDAGIKYKLIEENAQGESTNAATIASSFASNESIDLILAISTPIALAMANAEKDRPILFTAITDPVDAQLVPSWTEAGANITGTSDGNPGAKPVELVTEAMPEVQTIGVLYNASEPNSLVQVEQYQAEAAELGITLKVQAITSAAEISVGLESLVGVDAILIPTDNTVVNAIDSVIAFGREKQIPVFCADTSTVSKGTVAARGLSYYELGRATGEMAVKILRDGVDISTITPEAPTSTELVINPTAAAAFGLTLPEDLVAQAATIEE